MIVINVFFSLIIIVYGSDHVLVRIIIANFGGFPNEYILLVKEFAGIYTTFAVFEAVFTVWNLCPRLKNLKKRQGHTLA
ncbi:hypothetical protein Gorai_023789 [Gossypium raimondii]|uniref:Uncharacterized protein n=1 Tax=Gossypium raimondii TaxID=29730 RepID=A0A7J8NXN8_GOSRA|nr:hypothetical protein [Gossypium raimondii]